MEVKVFTGGLLQAPVDTVVVGIFEGTGILGNGAAKVDKALDGAISKLVESGELTGKHGDFVLLHTFGRLAASKVAVVGLGKVGDWSLERLRRIAGETGRSLRRARTRKAGLEVLGAGVNGVSLESASWAVTEGMVMGLYVFRKYLTRDADEKAVEELLLVNEDPSRTVEVEGGCRLGQVLADAVNRARDMVNEPA
ncbi:MAG: hypothetical protein N3E40_00290, partial [Dehalococcoidia bacterium]|nr:hypothetical protein [Dehalococcoidia bacterium]